MLRQASGKRRATTLRGKPASVCTYSPCRTGPELTSHVAINLEGLSLPIKPYPMLDFGNPETATWMKTMTDKQVHGQSTAEIKHVPANVSTKPNAPAHMLWQGNISTALPEHRPDVLKTGYAAWRNEDLGNTLFGEMFWNVDSYMYLALRVRSDGRKYFVNIQTDSIVPTDIHQHRLYTKHHEGADGPSDPGRWETVLIKLHEFVRTNQGRVTEPQSEMLRQKIKSVGIGLTDRTPGPYKLGVAGIWATNLNERGQVDGRTGWQDCDTGSARLAEVTEERMLQKAEERRNLPQEASPFRPKPKPAIYD
jgi:NADH dehydrogenase [ubiquinone] 1 alpha subcomplex assembly factor 1